MNTKSDDDRRFGLLVTAALLLMLGLFCLVCGTLQIKEILEVPQHAPFWGRYFLVGLGIAFLVVSIYFFRRRSMEFNAAQRTRIPKSFPP
jgi:hypothetical protein